MPQTQAAGLLKIRLAEAKDIDGMWSIFQEVNKDGTTFPYFAETTREEFVAIWIPTGGTTYVAEKDDQIVGSYVIKPLWPGRGSHIAHGSYMVSSGSRGGGVGFSLGEHSIEAARKAGFRAMQFNLVVSSNHSAVRLWKKLGFNIIGTVPQAFAHPELGFVDAYVMHRFLK